MPNQGLTDFQFDCVIGAAVVAMSCFFIAIVWFRYTRAKRNLAVLAGRLGFPVTTDGRIPAIPRTVNNPAFNGNPPPEVGVAGSVRGRSVRFSTYYVGSGKSAHPCAEVAVAAQAHGFTFNLAKKNLALKFALLFEKKSAAIGDEGFDQHWYAATNDAETLRAFLLPELRAQLDRSSTGPGGFCLENDWLRYSERGSFFEVDQVLRCESAISLLCDLADAVEVAAEKFTPPPPPPNLWHDPEAEEKRRDADWGVKSPDYDDSP